MKRTEREELLKAIRKTNLLCVRNDGTVYEPQTFQAIGKEGPAYQVATLTGVRAWGEDSVESYRKDRKRDAEAILSSSRTEINRVDAEDLESLDHLLENLTHARNLSEQAQTLKKVFEKS